MDTETYVPSADQLGAIRSMAAKPGFGIFAAPGVGKTGITLAGLTLFKVQNAMQAALVVSPIRPMLQAWRQEGAKWGEFNGLRFSLVRGTPAQRLAALRVDADVYLINPEQIDWLASDPVASAALRADVLVLDESHKFKDGSRQRFKAIKSLRKYFRRVYLLTGTPAPERLQDLWSQIFLLDGGARLGKSITEFRNRYCDPEYVHGIAHPVKWHVRESERDGIIKAISDITTVIRLPPANIRRNEIFVEMPDEAMQDYHTLERDYAVALASGPAQAANAAGLGLKLRQFVNGAVYGEDVEENGAQRKAVRVTRPAHDAKLDALRDLIEEQNGAPMLVVVAWQHDVQRIRVHLDDQSIPYIGAGITDAKLEQVQADWDAGKLPVLLLHPQSGGEGLNLQKGGNAICWFGLTWSLKDYIQTNARLRAHLQQAGIVIHFLLVRGTVDEVVYAGLNVKDQNQTSFFDGLMNYLKGKL